MPRLYFAEAVKLMMRTLPCVLAIVGVHFLFGLGVTLYYGAVFGMAYLTRGMDTLSGFILLGGLGGSLAAYKAFKHYVLYLMKAGHIAVMAELLSRGRLPSGTNQLAWGKDQVQSRFKDVSLMFVVDGLVKGVVNVITNMMGGLGNLIPVEAVQQLIRLLQIVVRKGAEFIDEAILARAFMLREQNVFAVAKDGTLLYAQAWKPILINAAGLALISWASFPVFLILFTPVGLALNAVLPQSMSFMPTVVVIALAYLGKASLGDTFALASTLATFHHETKDLVPNAEWDARLTAASDKFRELKARAVGAFQEKTGGTPAPVAQAIPAV